MRLKVLLPLFTMALFSNLLHAKSVLYLGDSQSFGKFGSFFAQDLEKGNSLCTNNPVAENTVTHLAVSGSSPRHWGDPKLASGLGGWLCQRPMKQYTTGSETRVAVARNYCDASRRKKVSVLDEAISQHNPDMVVFQFLGNSAWFYQRAMEIGGEAGERYLRRTIREYLRRILASVGNRECLFVTSNPAHMSFASKNEQRQALQAKFKEYINEINPNCMVIEGNNEETVRTIASDSANYVSDRLHMSAQGGRLFADYIKRKRCDELNFQETTREALNRSHFYPIVSSLVCQ